MWNESWSKLIGAASCLIAGPVQISSIRRV
jgi:hypothetical protein